MSNSGGQSMLFNSITFLIFFPVFLVFYFLSRGELRLMVCLAASYLFYGWWDYRFLSLILWCTLLDYSAGLVLGKTENQRIRTATLICSICLNLGTLAIFKYFNFFIDSSGRLLELLGLDPNLPGINIILPVGLSFYTFQTMSYTIDVYRGIVAPEQSLLRFATFVAFFPQLVAGPIVRAVDFLPDLRVDKAFIFSEVLSGSVMVAWGYFLKCGLADSLAMVVDDRFQNPSAHNGLSMSVGVLFYAFQIYGDFAGYSLIAIGIAKILGFDFGQNFRRPYFSSSFSEFWTRWHISLSTWLRDYLYIPLGGNRHGKWITYRNLMVTMLLGGLWHGAAWTFVMWGALNGVYLVVERVFDNRLRTSLPQHHWLVNNVFRLWRIALVFFAVCVSWVLFRGNGIENAFEVFRTIANNWEGKWWQVPSAFSVAKGALLIILVVGVDLVFELDLFKNAWGSELMMVTARCSAIVLLIWLISFLGTFGANAFIYFQF